MDGWMDGWIGGWYWYMYMNRQILNFGKIAVLVCKFSFVVERVQFFSIRIGEGLKPEVSESAYAVPSG